MHDSQCYRYNAAECLRAARNASQPHYRKLYLQMSSTWLTLADQDDATDDMLAGWGMIDAADASRARTP
jgi:hypothetical protein